MRLCTFGLYDENGCRYKPNIVRVGLLDRNPPEIVRRQSIEYLAQQELNNMRTFDRDEVQKDRFCCLLTKLSLILEWKNHSSNSRRIAPIDQEDWKTQKLSWRWQKYPFFALREEKSPLFKIQRSANDETNGESKGCNKNTSHKMILLFLQRKNIVKLCREFSLAAILSVVLWEVLAQIN